MGLAATAALYVGCRCTSSPGQSERKGVGLAAAAATVLYRRRRCSVVRTVSHDNDEYHVLRRGARDIIAGAAAATAL